MRMRGGEIMQGRRRKYRRNEDRIEQFKANYMQDQLRWGGGVGSENQQKSPKISSEVFELT